MSIIKSIRTIPMFIKGVLSFRKKEYKLTFVKDKSDGVWYIDMPWPGDRSNLAMVSGSDKLLSFLKKEDGNKVILNVRPRMKKTKFDGFFECERTSKSLFGGATYIINGLPDFCREIWICPVTLCVLGNYPKYIYMQPVESMYHRLKRLSKVIKLRTNDPKYLRDKE